MPLSPKIMIDCSATEMAAIESSFEIPQIRLCHWHIIRPLQKHVRMKIRISSSAEEQSIIQIRRSAIKDFIELMHTETVDKFGQVWWEYRNKYHQHDEWLKYLIDNWLKYPEKWWRGNRVVSSFLIKLPREFTNIKFRECLKSTQTIMLNLGTII